MANSQRHLSARHALTLALFALMLAAGAAVGFFQIYSHWVPDDDGYLMITVRNFLNGHRLYDQVFTQYGPIYYLYKAVLHRVSGLPVTHDAVRLLTLGAWLLTTLLCSLFSYRVTRSRFVATAVFLLTFRSLWMLIGEPGHPQELCVLLLASGVYLSSFADSAGRLRWVLPGLGAIAAALALTKINCGLYFCLALAGAMVSFADSQWVRRVAGSLLVTVAFSLPLCLMWSHLNSESVQVYAAVAAASGISGLAVAIVRNGRELHLARFAAVLAGFLITALLILIAVACCGNSVAGIWEGVVTGPLRFPSQFVLVVALPFSGAVLAAVAAVAAIGYCLSHRGQIQLSDRASAAISAVSILIRTLWVIEVVAVLSAIFGTLADLPTFVAPWIWLMLTEPSHRQSTLSKGFGRTLVVLTAALEVLYAYPVSGTQWSTATFLIVPAVAIGAHDIWLRWQSSTFRLPAKVAVVCAACGYILIGQQWWTSYRSFEASYRDLTPLNLPGARWLRLREHQVAVLRCVTINLRDNCDTFFSAPAINSFYFWSGLKAPTDFNPGMWMMLLDDVQKRAIIEQLERHSRVWFIYDRPLFELWRSGYVGPPADDPLARYCQTRFQPMVRVGEYDLCLPKGATRPVLEEAANVGLLPSAILAQPSQFGLPSNASSNVLIQPRFTLDADRRPALARVVIIDAADRSLLADSNDDSTRGLKVLDADLRPVKLPLAPGWNEDPRLEFLQLIPYEAWRPPSEYDYSKVLAGFFDEQGQLIDWLPVAIPVAQTSQ